MEQNNNDIVERQDNLEYAKLVETMYAKKENKYPLNAYSQQPLTDNTVLQHQSSSRVIIRQPQIQSANTNIHLVSNQIYQEYSSSQSFNGFPSQQINSQNVTPSHVMNYTTTTSPIKSVNNLQDTINVGPQQTQQIASTSSLVPLGIEQESESFRAAEFVLKNLDSVPGEEKFYDWNIKTKDFASNQKFYAQNINSNSSDLHLDQLTIVVTSPESEKINKEKNVKNPNWITERDRILKKYSQRLMRKKPRSYQPADDSSSDI